MPKTMKVSLAFKKKKCFSKNTYFSHFLRLDISFIGTAQHTGHIPEHMKGKIVLNITL